MTSSLPPSTGLLSTVIVALAGSTSNRIDTFSGMTFGGSTGGSTFGSSTFGAIAGSTFISTFATGSAGFSSEPWLDTITATAMPAAATPAIKIGITALLRGFCTGIGATDACGV